MTTREYLMMPAASRLRYRLYRHPLVLKHRLPWDMPRSWWREWLSVGVTNIVLLGILVAAATTMGMSTFLMVHVPICIVAFTAAIWLFFVQHQFEATYWRPHHDWDFCEAGLLGSSYYDLPPLLHWFSGNIGFHHVHHLAARIPNYRLQQCVRENPSLPCPSRISIRQSLGFVRLALWDEDQQKLIGFSDLGHRAPAVGTERADENRSGDSPAGRVTDLQSQWQGTEKGV
jgi:acyl-lipid omega-6 desaturase (Delta-12 desaturase)